MRKVGLPGLTMLLYLGAAYSLAALIGLRTRRNLG